jgi:hypothetical protein
VFDENFVFILQADEQFSKQLLVTQAVLKSDYLVQSVCIRLVVIYEEHFYSIFILSAKNAQ